MKSSPFNIGIVTWDFLSPKGGLGRAMQMIASGMKEAGHDVRVLTPKAGDDAYASWTKKVGLHPIFSLCVFLGISSWISRTKREIIVVPCGPGGVWLFRKLHTCKVVAIVHHTSWQQSRLVPGQWWKRVFVPFEKRTLRCADKVCCYSEDTQKILLQHYKCQADVIPHFVDTEADVAVVQKETGLCVCIARLEKRKGVQVLVDAWKTVAKQYPAARLEIVGDGHLALAIDTVCLGCSSVVRTASLPRKELLALISRAEILICPSYLEGFGLAVAEAMALSTPVIASNADGLTSLLSHEETGILVHPGDSGALADAIILLLEDDQRRIALAERAKQDFQMRFSAESAKTALQKTFESLY
jgi:glycosyltransferase involved in cell wall biosynthesis